MELDFGERDGERNMVSLLGFNALLAVTFVSAFGPRAHAADSLLPLTCRFSEPAIEVLVDPATGTGSVRRAATAETKLQGLAIEDLGDGKLRVALVEDLSEILVIDFNREGSDGSSNRIYPYEGIFTNGIDAKPAKSFGGCETSTRATPFRL